MRKSDLVETMHKSGFSCSQIVATLFSQEMGVDKSTIFKMAEGFGGGICGRRDLCGAVSGMVIALGGVYGSDINTPRNNSSELYELTNNAIDTFLKKHSTLNCQELLDINAAKGGRNCDGYIVDCVDIVQDIIDNKK